MKNKINYKRIWAVLWTMFGMAAIVTGLYLGDVMFGFWNLTPFLNSLGIPKISLGWSAIIYMIGLPLARAAIVYILDFITLGRFNVTELATAKLESDKCLHEQNDKTNELLEQLIENQELIIADRNAAKKALLTMNLPQVYKDSLQGFVDKAVELDIKVIDEVGDILSDAGETLLDAGLDVLDRFVDAGVSRITNKLV